MNTDGQQPDLLDLSSVGDDHYEHTVGGRLPVSHFPTPELTQRLDLLRHLTDNSERIPLIMAPEGGGKTTLLQKYQEGARDNWELCCIEASALLQPDQLFHMLCNRFGIHTPEQNTLEQLLDCFDAMRNQGQMPVIAIDDTHMLPVATIIALLRLHERRTGSQALVRILLFADPQISDQLQTPQIQAMNLQGLQELDIPLFDHAQSVAFARFLLSGGDDAAAPGLDATTLERIAKSGRGLPGVLEKQAVSLLSGDVIDEIAQLDAGKRSLFADLPRSALFGGVALLVLLLLTLLFQDKINTLFDAPQGVSVPIAQETPAGVVPLAIPKKKMEPLGATVKVPTQPMMPETLDQPARKGAVREEGTERVTQPDLPNAEQSLDASAGSVAKAPQAPPKEVPDKPLSMPGKPVVGRAGVVEVPLSDIQIEPSTVIDSKTSAAMKPPKVDDVKEGAPATSTVKLPELATKEGVAPLVVKPLKEDKAPLVETLVVVPKLAPAPVTQAAPALVTAETPDLIGEAWLHKQDAKSYTLQLVGVGEAAAARGFIERHQLAPPTGYFKTLRNGRSWYSVIHGLYKDRDAALKGKQELPKPLASSGAWPRSIGSIQAAIGP